jgi:hypothetical protein
MLPELVAPMLQACLEVRAVLGWHAQETLITPQRMRDWIFDFELWRHHFLGALEASARRLHVPPILARKVNGLKIV